MSGLDGKKGKREDEEVKALNDCCLGQFKVNSFMIGDWSEITVNKVALKLLRFLMSF